MQKVMEKFTSTRAFGLLLVSAGAMLARWAIPPWIGSESWAGQILGVWILPILALGIQALVLRPLRLAFWIDSLCLTMATIPSFFMFFASASRAHSMQEFFDSAGTFMLFLPTAATVIVMWTAFKTFSHSLPDNKKMRSATSIATTWLAAAALFHGIYLARIN